MTPKLLRLAFVLEFLVALVAIFTAWSEVGGQAALDSMAWFWKLGLSVFLAIAIVGFSAALTLEDRLWTLRSARWLTGLILIIVAMGMVTYYFQVQLESGDGEENSAVSNRLPSVALSLLTR
jgi:hypothetical protein